MEFKKKNKNTKELQISITDWLYIANFYKFIQTGFIYKLDQISSYNWL